MSLILHASRNRNMSLLRRTVYNTNTNSSHHNGYMVLCGVSVESLWSLCGVSVVLKFLFLFLYSPCLLSLCSPLLLRISSHLQSISTQLPACTSSQTIRRRWPPNDIREREQSHPGLHALLSTHCRQMSSCRAMSLIRKLA